MKKIKKDELSKLQELVNSIQEAQSQLGGLELQKHQIITKANAARELLNDVQRELQEKYGEVNISLATGEITDVDNSQD